MAAAVCSRCLQLAAAGQTGGLSGISTGRRSVGGQRVAALCAGSGCVCFAVPVNAAFVGVLAARHAAWSTWLTAGLTGVGGRRCSVGRQRVVAVRTGAGSICFAGPPVFCLTSGPPGLLWSWLLLHVRDTVALGELTAVMQGCTCCCRACTSLGSPQCRLFTCCAAQADPQVLQHTGANWLGCEAEP